MLFRSGITVVSLEHAVAAPFCARQLADLGARVIKVEAPGTGDDSRTWGNILGLAIPATAVSNIALVKAIKAIGPTLTSILGAMEPLTAVLIGVLHFGEPFTAAGIAGVVLSVAAVTIVVTQGGKPAGNA